MTIIIYFSLYIYLYMMDWIYPLYILQTPGRPSSRTAGRCSSDIWKIFFANTAWAARDAEPGRVTAVPMYVSKKVQCI